jgi:hypothetical protein
MFPISLVTMMATLQLSSILLANAYHNPKYFSHLYQKQFGTVNHFNLINWN